MNTQKYVRLLSYKNSCKLIDFINNNDKNDYANIIVGGVFIQVSEKNWNKVESFIKSLNDRYEISTEHPYKTQQQIVENIKSIKL